MSSFYQEDNRTALEAISDAQRIAFAPFTFQATVALSDLGLLDAIDQGPDLGMSVDDLQQQTALSRYGIKVLLDAGLSIGLLYLNGAHYRLTKTGRFMLHDQMTRVNFEFSRDFCYQGLEHLKESVRTGKPQGLPIYAEGETLYPHLATLPEPAKSSWFNFDHYYSDNAFPRALPIVFAREPALLLDIGGNTGKWAIQCATYDANIQIKVLDLAPQLAVMEQNALAAGFSERIEGLAVDMLDPEQKIPVNADAIWMSQFLDCFSEAQIRIILSNVVKAMGPNTRFYILETFLDRQTFEAATYSLSCTSLYFTCFANGGSRMYHAGELLGLLQDAGLSVVQDIDNIGISHTLLVCKL